MNLISKVIFSYDIRAGRFGQSSSFESIDELKQVIQEAQYQKPYTLSVYRYVQMINTALKAPSEPSNAFIKGREFENRAIESEKTTDKIDLVVVDKLLYPQDVREILTEKYGSVLNFKSISDVRPVLFYGIKSHKEYVFSDEKAKPIKQINTIEADYRYAQDNDIIVDANLNQIWPEKTGNAPDKLMQLLAKINEIIK